MVEVQLQLVGAGGDGLTARELQDIDQVLVGDLGELTTLIRVQVDVVHIQGGGGQTALTDTVADGVGVRRVRVVPADVIERVELEIDADLVVLESNEREGKARVAAEPELEGDVERVHWCTAGDDLRREGLAAIAVIVARGAALVEEVREFRDVTNHLGVAGLLARLLRELIPDVEPVAILLIDALATDFNLDVFNDVVTNPVEPAELSTRAIRGLELYLRERGLEVHAVD